MAPQSRLNHAVHPAGKAIAHVAVGVDAIRAIRTHLMNLAYALAERAQADAYLVLVDPSVTYHRLQDEWDHARGVLRPEIIERLTVCVMDDEFGLRALPRDPAPDVRPWLFELAEREKAGAAARGKSGADFEFIVVKLLLHQWLVHRRPVTLTRLARAAGCSYPTVARILKGMGGVIERHSDRSASLRYLPRQQLEAFVARSVKARSTMRFVDRSGRPRAPESHLRRLETLRAELPELAIGGVLGARHYCPQLDIVGAPRLDLSIHAPKSPPDISFVKRIDPALALEEDPRHPPSLVIHVVRHAEALFTPRDAGLAWADPVECFLDLREAGLEAQATEFLDYLKETRST